MIGVHAVKKRLVLLNEVLNLLKEFEEPDYVFYLYSDILTRRKRFNERQAVKAPAYGDKLVFEDIDSAIYREETFRKYVLDIYNNSEVIDNSYRKVNDVGNDVYNKILYLNRKGKKNEFDNN